MADKGKIEKFILEDLQQKQRFIPTPTKMDNLVSQLLTRRGYARGQAATQQTELWNELVGKEVAKSTRAGAIRRGVLEVLCQSSAVMQELAFKKETLIKQLNNELLGKQLVDIKLRVADVTGNEESAV